MQADRVRPISNPSPSLRENRVRASSHRRLRDQNDNNPLLTRLIPQFGNRQSEILPAQSANPSQMYGFLDCGDILRDLISARRLKYHCIGIVERVCVCTSKNCEYDPGRFGRFIKVSREFPCL